MSFPSSYLTGTIDVTNGSTAVVGHGTLWTAAAMDGDFLIVLGAGTDWHEYEIQVNSDTSITFSRAYGGTTGTGLAYYIRRASVSRDSQAFVSKQVTDILNTYQSLISLSGNDRYFTLDKTSSTDNAGHWFKQGGVSKFRDGTWGDNNYHIQWLNGSTWVDALTIDAATGAISAAAISTGKRGAARIVDTSDSDPATSGYTNGATLDGKTLVTGDRVLRAATGHTARNGVWIVAASGGAARAVDFSTFDLIAGSMIVISDGTANANTVWFCSANAGGVLDTDALTYTKISTTPGVDGVSAGLAYSFDSTVTMAAPATGNFRLNNATIASVTAIAVQASTSDNGNPDVSDFIATWGASTNSGDKGQITLRKKTALGTYAVFKVTGAVTDNGTWLQIPVAYVESVGSFSNADSFYIQFARTGNGIAASGASGNLVAFDGAGGLSDSGYSVDQLNLNIAQLELLVADALNQALFIGTAGNRFADSFDALTFVDTANATNLDTSEAGVLKPYALAGGTTSYLYPGGKGNRTALITASMVGLSFLGGASATKFIDGYFTNAGSSFNAATLSSSTYIQFDFGAPVWMTEATWYQAGAAAQGTWKWRGSNDGSTWTDIGASFALGGSATQVLNQLASNASEYRYYRLEGVSGSVDTSVNVLELEFKLGRVSNPSYANAGGTGDRRASIAVSASSGLLAGVGPANALVDGNNSTDTSNFINIVALNGTQYIEFDFGAGVKKRITEAKLYQSDAQTHGTWQWRGSNDRQSWTDIGTSFTLGGATVQTITILSGNAFGYRYYRLCGLSGTSANPYVREFEFQITDQNDTYPSVSVTSKLLSSAGVPTKMRLVAFFAPLDVYTLNTDALFSVSRNGGTGWTAATMVDQFVTPDGAYHVLSTGDISVSAQASGQVPTWKFATANNKNMKLLAIYIYWA